MIFNIWINAVAFFRIIYCCQWHREKNSFIQFIFSWTNKKGRIDSNYEFGINSAFNFQSFDILDDHYRFVEKNHKSPSNTTTTVLSTSVVWILMPPISDWHHEKGGLFFFSWTNKKGRIDSNYDFWNQLCLWFNFSKFRHSLKKLQVPAQDDHCCFVEKNYKSQVATAQDDHCRFVEKKITIDF